MSYSEDFNYRDCPWCQTKNIAFSVVTPTTLLTDSKRTNREWTWLSCTRCSGVVSVETQYNHNPATILKVVPDSHEDVDVKYLPEDVKTYYGNAITALNANIPSSAAVELRRTLEAAAKHKNVEERNLVTAVKKLVEMGLITKDFESVLSHVRKIGNQGAHAGDAQLSEDEVRLALTFTTQVLRNLFEVPESLRLLQSGEDEPTEEIA